MKPTFNWRTSLAFLHDVLAAAVAWGALWWTRFSFDLPAPFADDMLHSMAWVVPMQAAIFLAFGLYRGLWRFASIVDLKRIAGLSGVRALPGGGFAIGAATPCTSLKDDRALAAAWPGVVEAANLIGSVQVRNRATMAGNCSVKSGCARIEGGRPNMAACWSTSLPPHSTASEAKRRVRVRNWVASRSIDALNAASLG